MTQKEKQLLLQDLSSRLPYGVIVVDHYGFVVSLTWEEMKSFEDGYKLPKPYLRPMSSMTEEEKREIYNWLVENDVDWFDFNKLRLDEILISFDSSWLLINWLNEHHFDYHGLIEKGLALAAPEGMYN